MGDDVKTWQETLNKHGQDHLLRFWDDLTETGKAKLIAQLREIDWEAVEGWVQKYVLQQPAAGTSANLRPAPCYPACANDKQQEEFYKKAREKGEELLASGRIAGFTVAGGQGTRLGFDGPKGTFPISPVKNKTLFQLFAEMIQRAEQRYNTHLYWYIMTSPLNHDDTRHFFENHAYFGLHSDQVRFFMQGSLPAIDFQGKLLLEAKDTIAKAPDGHGGSLAALRRSGALDEMKANNVEHISYWQVDNPLVKCFDPLFIGLHALTESDVSSRALRKQDPFEKLGNFCLADDELRIIEYSDFPSELAEEKDENGNLRFSAGSPAIHLFRRDFVERVTADNATGLPFHRAEKKVPYVDEQGSAVKPDEPNAVKLEMFIFDVLPMAKNSLILEAERREQFAPLKSATGPDSIDVCRHKLSSRAGRWLENGGVPVPRTPDGEMDCVVELSSKTYLDQTDVYNAAPNLGTPARNAETYYP